jgi:DNA helicase-2/ATP-dependent DNA helicase PcrA
VDHLLAYAKTRNAPLFETLRDVEHDQTLSTRARNSIEAFVTLIDDLAIVAKSGPVAPVAESLLSKTAYQDYVRRSSVDNVQVRLEVIDEFVNACAEFDARGAKGLSAFLQELALASDVDGLDADAPPVTLLTCHSAKGLEFDHVFLIGLEEGLLPHGSALGDDKELEEERRLCYVAMTRARRRLTLSDATKRVIHGESRDCRPSRFLGEIPTDLVEVAGVRRPRKTTRSASGSAPIPAKADTGAIKTGTRVRHATFGEGYVMYSRGTGAKTRIRIRFKTGKASDFMLSHAPIEVLDGGKKR